MLTLLLLLAPLFPLQGPKPDGLGLRLCPLNDVDGDHRPDLAVDDGQGWLWVVSGKMGKVLAQVDGNTKPIARSCIAPLFGDVDGDGAWDLIDWHRDCDVLLRSGKDLHVIRKLELSSDGDTLLGSPVAAGDWNGDGSPDVAVLASRDRKPAMPQVSGHRLPWIAVISGKDGSLLAAIGPREEWKQDEASSSPRLRIVSSCQRFDQQPATIVLIGIAPHVLILLPRGKSDDPISIKDWTQPESPEKRCGFVGDVDGDRYPDLVMRTGTSESHPKVPFKHEHEGFDRGVHTVAVLVSGLTGADLQVLSDLSELHEGLAATALGDPAKNEGIEMLVAAPGFLAGEVLVFSAKDRSLRRRMPESEGCCAGACRFGASVADLGDVDGDGIDDFAVGSSWGADKIDPGCVNIYSGKTREHLRVIWKADLIRK